MCSHRYLSWTKPQQQWTLPQMSEFRQPSGYPIIANVDWSQSIFSMWCYIRLMQISIFLFRNEFASCTVLTIAHRLNTVTGENHTIQPLKSGTEEPWTSNIFSNLQTSRRGHSSCSGQRKTRGAGEAKNKKKTSRSKINFSLVTPSSHHITHK